MWNSRLSLFLYPRVALLFAFGVAVVLLPIFALLALLAIFVALLAATVFCSRRRSCSCAPTRPGSSGSGTFLSDSVTFLAPSFGLCTWRNVEVKSKLRPVP